VIVMSPVFVASQSRCSFLCSPEKFRLVENRLNSTHVFRRRWRKPVSITLPASQRHCFFVVYIWCRLQLTSLRNSQYWTKSSFFSPLYLGAWQRSQTWTVGYEFQCCSQRFVRSS
jgi:hypothetical protein